jgi:hypothetical protein
MVFHDSAEQLLEKLRRLVARLDKHKMHADDITDFCLTAWHMVEWAGRSPEREVRKRAHRLRFDPDIALCRLVANREKHPEARLEEEERANFSEAKVERAWGLGRFGKGSWGVGEQRITFKLNDGTERDAREFARALLAKWENVFESSSS